ncbi:MAG TPA: DNA polymerase III subunit gamma/tau [Candidatus Saccharimonadales bacterium]|nr:DNA polymerase III subunit gamma/tau [Candidatus Saccharimonadales bacterium]
MGQALYRKYRPKSLAEIVGQEHITTVLEHTLKLGTPSHAYLLTGPKGVGKTSVARILAHAVNDLPYNEESSHLDIIEIDAASNRRIDEIRELRERVYSAPTSAKYKVYIIDEVHMLTREAFNALLKILEEPPAHVIFILATTEAHKLPDTIISRTQRFTFRPVVTDKAAAHLRTIATAEKIDIDDEALRLIAVHGDGSLRDSTSLLDQVRNQTGRITSTSVLNAVGQAPAKLIDDVNQAIANQDVSEAMLALGVLRDQGYEAARIAKQLGEQWRSDIVADHSSLPKASALKLLAALIEVPVSPNPTVALEIALLECINATETIAKSAPETTSTKPQAVNVPKKPTKPVVEEAAKPVEATSKPAVSAAKISRSDVAWPEVLNIIKRTHNTLYSVLRLAQPTWDGDHLTLAFRFAFHQKRVNEAVNRRIIITAISELTGQNVTVTSVVDESLAKQPEIIDEPVGETLVTIDSAEVESISNIFGGAELLES